MDEAFPEIVMEKPSAINNWRWCWAICAPVAAWGTYQEGQHESESRAKEDARQAMLKVVKEHYPSEYAWVKQDLDEDRLRYHKRVQQAENAQQERMNGKATC